MDDRSAKINIGGREFELILTTRATKEIAGRYGGLENLGQKLMRSENFEMALDELVWLINRPVFLLPWPTCEGVFIPPETRCFYDRW